MGATGAFYKQILDNGYSYDGVSAGIWVIHIEGCQIWVQAGDGI